MTRALQNKGITFRIFGRKSRSTPVKYDDRIYKRRNRIEIMFGRKDWRRVATQYYSSPELFLSAIALAAPILGRSAHSFDAETGLPVPRTILRYAP